MKFLNYCRHKTAEWEGVLYEDNRKETRVSNGLYDWPLTPKREEDLEIVERIDVPKLVAFLESRPAGEALISLLHTRGGK